MEEVERWRSLANDDFESAKVNYETKRYYISVFLCQQAVEKWLKALLIKKTGKLIKIHDLVMLGKRVGLPKNLLEMCDRLNGVYIDTRYGDLGGELPSQKFNNKNSLDFLNIAEEVLKWLKKNI